MVRYFEGFLTMDELIVRVFECMMSDLVFYSHRGTRLWLLLIVVAKDRCASNLNGQCPLNLSGLTAEWILGDGLRIFEDM